MVNSEWSWIGYRSSGTVLSWRWCSVSGSGVPAGCKSCCDWEAGACCRVGDVT